MSAVLKQAMPADRGAFDVNGFCAWAGIGRTTFYKEVNEGRLSIRKLGKKTVVVRTEAERWLNALPPADPTLEALR